MSSANPNPSASASAVRERQTFDGASLVARYASLVRLPHTLFALPFAGIGAILATYQHTDRFRFTTLLWIIIAFTAARFAAMAFNRIVDREYDALNPRTRLRELPAGRLSVTQAIVAVIVASVVFVLAAALLNPQEGKMMKMRMRIAMV